VEHHQRLYLLEKFESPEPSVIVEDERYHVLKSYSQLTYQLALKIRDREVEVRQVSDKLLHQLLLSVFPGGNTVMHILAPQPRPLEDILVWVSSQRLKGNHVHVPFIHNSDRKTPTDLASTPALFQTYLSTADLQGRFKPIDLGITKAEHDSIKLYALVEE